MEYTKDIIIGIRYQKDLFLLKIKKWTSKIKTIILKNKIIVLTLILLSLLMIADFVLLNSFFELLTKLH